jgi:chorismate synthase
MSGNSFGKALVLTTFGESHGPAVGAILDGFPSNIEIDLSFVQSELERRRSKGYVFSTSRVEEDKIQVLSGIFDNKSTGAPVAFIILNRDQKPEDYLHLKDVYRPSHADYTYKQKYGNYDYRGSGRASARETVARVAGGAFAKILLHQHSIVISAYVSRIGTIRMKNESRKMDPEAVINSPVGCPDEEASKEMMIYLERLKSAGDTAGGIITCRVNGVPAGLGEPVFDKLHADLAKAMLSINAVKGFDYGSGFDASSLKGSEHNDVFIFKNKQITTATNFSGGIQGGISNGNEIYFRVAFKPVSTLMMDQETVNQKGEKVTLKGKGRHDVCVVPRAIPVVEAMTALVIADHLIRQGINAPHP